MSERLSAEALADLAKFCAQADAARAELDNDFPVGAAARGKWHEARRAMVDAVPSLLEHIAALTRDLETRDRLLRRVQIWIAEDEFYDGSQNACPVSVIAPDGILAEIEHCISRAEPESNT